MSGIIDPVIPPGWAWQPLDSLATVLVSTVDKKSYPGELPVRLCNYTDVYYNDEITAGMNFMPATASPNQLIRFGVKAGDVVITKDSETSDDIGRPAYVPIDLDGVVYGYHLAIYSPFDLRFGKFLKYIFDSAWVRAQLHVRTPGVTRVGLSQNTLKNLKIPVPPSPAAAKRIADFLDHETAEIDAFIADQERLIELLEERRAATITHAVTKGLDPAVPMKDSGVESLGDVVAEWEVVAVSRFVSFGNGSDYKHVEVAEGGYPVIGSGGEFRRASDYLFDGESVLFGRKGTVDKPLYVTGKFWTVDTMYYTNIDTRYLVPKFLYYWALRIPFDFYLTNTALPSMTQTDLGSAKIALPDRAEQDMIVEYLDRETAEIDAAVSDAQEAIALSRERRAALISAAVTGQLDVSQAQSRGSVGEVLEDEVRV